MHVHGCSIICVLNTLNKYIDIGCVIVFNNIVNYPEFEGESGACRAVIEFVSRSAVSYEYRQDWWDELLFKFSQNRCSYNCEFNGLENMKKIVVG